MNPIKSVLLGYSFVILGLGQASAGQVGPACTQCYTIDNGVSWRYDDLTNGKTYSFETKPSCDQALDSDISCNAPEGAEPFPQKR